MTATASTVCVKSNCCSAAMAAQMNDRQRARTRPKSLESADVCWRLVGLFVAGFRWGMVCREATLGCQAKAVMAPVPGAGRFVVQRRPLHCP